MFKNKTYEKSIIKYLLSTETYISELLPEMKNVEASNYNQ